MPAMWLLQRRRVEQPAGDPSRARRLLTAVNGQAGIAVLSSLALGLASMAGLAMRLIPDLPSVGSVS
jgi:hypothetical protein